MATFNPDQSLLPSVGGSITPMSGGGTPHQEGGEVKADGPVLLEAKLSDYDDNKPMRTALAKMAPVYFKNSDIQKGIKDLFEKGGDFFNEKELAIKKEILNHVSTLPPKLVKRFIDPEKKGSIENTPESQLQLMTYIASRKIDVAKMKITLNKDELVISYTIPGPAAAGAAGPGAGGAPGAPEPEPAAPEAGAGAATGSDTSNPKTPKPKKKMTETTKTTKTTDTARKIADAKKTAITILKANKVEYGFPPRYEGTAPPPHVMPTAKITPTPFTPVKGGGTNEIYIMVNSVNDAIEELNTLYDNHDIDVLNFANKKHVGGGVEEGAPAQEEELCRTSPVLYNSLLLYANPASITNWREGSRYEYLTQKWTDFLLYTPNVPIIRYDVQKKYKKLDKPITVSVITAAADDSQKTNMTFKAENAPEELKTGFKTLISSISKAYTSAKTDEKVTWKVFDAVSRTITGAKPPMESKKKRILLLGPWGCGAFAPQGDTSGAKIARNEYRTFIATQFCEVLKQTKLDYDKIIFTFYEPIETKKDMNLKQFVNVLKGDTCFKDKIFPLGSKITENDNAKWNELINPPKETS